MKRRSAVFLDRDGTLIEELEFLSRVDQVRLLPSAAQAVRLLNQSGLCVVLVTNQSGVARGCFDEKTLQQIHQKLEELLKAEGASLDAIYYCPHHPEGRIAKYRKVCECRKPASGMFRRAAQDLLIDLKRSAAIGDSLRDVEAGKASGTYGVLVETGYGKKELARLTGAAVRSKNSSPDFVASGILQAAQWVVDRMTS